ncbi:MAG TPA: TIR domain-containing protein [Verrucomicrobiota bacterium]|nr:hypothetical protein [Verrucomicrobiales bacterium]HRI15323.1 TIR domain-containing protein [Verrucomicrobiota bacterium]
MDIFISYTHIDNQPLTEGQQGWIAQFHRLLEIRLAMLLGEQPKVWRDLKLNRTDDLSEAIMEQLLRAGILVSVVSPRYVKSEWCVREATEYLKRTEQASAESNQLPRRWVKVVKTPVPPTEVPDQLRQGMEKVLGFNFYRLDPETGRPHEFDTEFGPEYKLLFLQQIYDLAYDLCNPPKRANGAAKLPKLQSGRTVYLATTTSDLQEERQLLARELQERGHNILPEAPQPTLGTEFEAAVRADLAKSDLAVQLVGSRYGLIPEDSAESVVELQNRLAAERSASNGLARFLWMPRGVIPKDERQRAFTQRLFEDAAAQKGAEIVQDSLERLKILVLDKLAPPAAKPVPPPPSATGPNRVYLICDRADEGPLIDAIEDHLFDQGFEVNRTNFEGSEAEVSAAHRQHLQLSDAVIVYYGAGSRGWVDMKLLDLAQAPGYGRTKPFSGVLVCVVPPEDKVKPRFRTHAAEVVRLGETLQPELLAPFVQKVKGAGA